MLQLKVVVSLLRIIAALLSLRPFGKITVFRLKQTHVDPMSETMLFFQPGKK